jgi:ubiquinone/menaquinone biosynthesis C-methylase UbiE
MTANLDYAALRAKTRATWSAGDFAQVGTMIAIVGELLCDTIDLHANADVLDVATGSGNTAIAAARRFARVTGVDFVPALLERGRERAAAEGLKIEFVEGDAQALPFPDDSFDVVLSTFGVMFAPDQPLAAAEMCRVLRPGGTIGLSNWVPDGAVGDMFRTTAKHNPPPPGLTPPTAWGTPQRLAELFPDAQIELTPRVARVTMPSIDFWLDYFRTWFGPTVKAFEAVGAAGAPALEADLRAFAARHNASGDDTLVIPQAYVDVVIKP